MINWSKSKGIKVTIEYGEYLVDGKFQLIYMVCVGNNVIEGIARFKIKPTKKELRKLKQSWYTFVKCYDYVTPPKFNGKIFK
jgi:hypothetical protein